MEDDGKTRIVRRGSGATNNDMAAETTQYVNSPFNGGDSATQYVDTVKLGGDSSAPTRVIPYGGAVSPTQSASGNKTMIYRGSKAPEAEKNWDPVVGWVVITKGNGWGKSFELGQGNNSIGKNSTNKVCLDFGDETISREEHLKIVYDPVNKKFWAVQNGNSRNLAYLNKAPILMPTELKAHDCISLGATELKFMPFCGENHSWDNDSTDSKQ